MSKMDWKQIQKRVEGYSPFCRKVWAVTSTIPSGQVRSYQWVAHKVGNPRAVRAVGQALRKNPFPSIIPCHRVIYKDGRLGGFSKGLKKKVGLLKKEGVLVSKTIPQKSVKKGV